MNCKIRGKKNPLLCLFCVFIQAYGKFIEHSVSAADSYFISNDHGRGRGPTITSKRKKKCRPLGSCNQQWQHVFSSSGYTGCYCCLVRWRGNCFSFQTTMTSPIKESSSTVRGGKQYIYSAGICCLSLFLLSSLAPLYFQHALSTRLQKGFGFCISTAISYQI